MKKKEKRIHIIDKYSTDKHSIEISHPDKVYFPQDHITKQATIEYYIKIALHLLPHIKDYTIVMRRFPEGIDGINFYQKQIPDYFPGWIKHKTVDLKKGDTQTLVIIDNRATLVYLANQGVLEFHSWLSNSKHIHKPTKLVFDLDPSSILHSNITKTDLASLRFGARALKNMLEQNGLNPFLMTTGSRGYHVVVPLLPTSSFEQVHVYAHHCAQTLVNAYPDLFTIEMNKKKRGKKVFIDYLRNAYGQTSVACYSLRALEGAPIATPLDWHELSKTTPQQYTIKNIFRRLAKKNDPWKDFEKSAEKLPI